MNLESPNLPINEKLLQKVEMKLRKPPKEGLQFRMETWVNVPVDLLDPWRQEDIDGAVSKMEERNWCGTAACIGGHMLIEAGALNKQTVDEGFVYSSFNLLIDRTKLGTGYYDYTSQWRRITSERAFWGGVHLANVTATMAADTLRFIRFTKSLPHNYSEVEAFFKTHQRRAYRARTKK